MTNKLTQIKQLADQILEQNICPELASQATQLVIGEGSLDAKIVFIGEAPGKKEDQTGKPFVGASGKFLDQLLESINLSRDKVYITNIVKYRPPNNRDPSMAEKIAFTPFLLRQLEIIQPEVVVTLGKHALSFFDKQLPIAQAHGQAIELKLAGTQLTLIPLYHPAAALYNGSLRQLLFDDFQTIRAKIKNT